MTVLKQAFPKSVAMQYANFMPEEKGGEAPEYLRSIYRKGVELKVGMGGPDLLPYKPYQMSHCYPLLREFAGRVPTGIAFQDGNYKHVNPKTGRQVTLPEVIQFATKYLKVDYIFWCTQKPFYEREVIPFLHGR